jgi:hypothetical protein
MARTVKTVFVYRNLSTHQWQYGPKAKSARTNPQAREIILRGVSFKVLQGGFNFTAKTFAQTGKRARTVHAFACGEIAKALPKRVTRREISYNPFKGNFFYFCDTGERVDACAFVHFSPDQKAYALTEI